MQETLPILFHDEHLVVVNKPSGLLVHRSMIDRHETRFALQILRDQLGQHVFPLHRLDKPTSGALIFALSAEAAKKANQQFQQHTIKKQYLAVVRGFPEAAGTIDHPLKEKLDKISDKKAKTDKPAQTALTHYASLATIELPVAIETYPSSRYGLVRCQPITGRKHQIRRHLKHINHPIIGDAKHGKGRHNRYFAEHLNAARLLLHCTQIEMLHPYSQETLTIKAPLDKTFSDILARFNWQQHIASELLHHTESR